MHDALELVVINVEAITVHAVPGHGTQAEVIISTARGALTLRLIARSGRTIRLLDLRQRDRRRADRLVTVPTK